VTARRAWTLATAAAALAAAVALQFTPAKPLRDFERYSAALYAEDGSLLRLTLAPDQQYRLWVPLESISPKLVEAVKLYEDRWFDYHGGFNAAALLRSGWATAFGDRRQGGSTLTMQLARKLYGIDSSNWPGKFKQLAAAWWIEARYSKHDILEAYLNFVPYGGNIEGAGAASLVYFHKRAADLTLPEALTLAVIPQNPRVRGAVATNSYQTKVRALNDARQRLAKIWLKEHPADATYGATLDLQPKPIASLPFRAPHLTTQLLAARGTGNRDGEVWTTVDPRMQTTLERVMAQYIERHQSIGIQNAAAVLLDAQTMQVKALVGSGDFTNNAIEGQVNGVLAKRSPGSTLKPFIYALGIDQGVLHPATVLKDAPTAFGPFSPENFDGRFVGPITAQDALVRSRNVPAVAVAAKLSKPSLYDLLKTSGVAQLASEKHYGLALTLGGGEVTMEELARLYAMLANGGELKAINYRKDEKAGEGLRLLSEESAFVTLDMLANNPRPDTGQPARPAVAWKTGTSWGFRDAWTAGVFGRYVLVVWIGNFDGSSNPAFIGVQAAAPLFFQVVDAMQSQGLAQPPALRLPPAQLTKVQVCAATGDLPNPYCKERAQTWFIPGKSPIRVSNLHRRVLVDTRTGQATCTETASTRWEVHEYWPSDMLRLFREAGMPRREPPRAPECAQLAQAAHGSSYDEADAPTIVSPLRGVSYTMRLSQPTPIALRANAGSKTQFWFADGGLVGQTSSGTALAWLPPKAGRYQLRVIDESGAADAREVQVEVVP
jgi:penicillin-binding protein 1C